MAALSAEAVSFIESIQERLEAQRAWLQENAPNITDEQAYLDEGSVERAYWHYGYTVALRDVLALLGKS